MNQFLAISILVCFAFQGCSNNEKTVFVEAIGDRFTIGNERYTEQSLLTYLSNVNDVNAVVLTSLDKRANHLDRFRNELANVLSQRKIGFTFRRGQSAPSGVE